MPDATRFCPICELRLDAEVCPLDQVPTVRADFDHASHSDDALGRIIAGRFRVERLIGQGASGRIYAATQLSVERVVALKLLQPHHARDRVHVRRFYREARAATRLDGEHVVKIHDFGVDDDTRTPFIAMELLSGETLRDRLARDGALAPAEAAAIGAQIARALVEASARGIVHRDLKPANIMISAGTHGVHVKVTDFGVAKDLDQRDTDTLTAQGAAVGTPAYMAPEQVSGGDVGPAADLYALGCILHELVTGHPPFESNARAELFVDHLLKPAPPLPDPLPSGARTPPALARLVSRLLAKSPTDRPRDASAVLAELGVLAQASPRRGPQSRRWRWPLLTALALLAALVLGWVITRGPRPAATAAAALTGVPPEVLDIDALVVRGGAATVRLHEGEARVMSVTGDPSLVTSTVEERLLTLSIRPSPSGAPLVVDLWSPAWRNVKASGAASVVSATPLTSDDASFNIAGSARADLEVHGPSLTTSIRGSSQMVLRGRVQRHDVRTAGAARLDASQLDTEETSLSASGSSDANVRATVRFEARNEGSGDILYDGAPADVTTDGGGIRPAPAQPR